jgi:hypothetical protein
MRSKQLQALSSKSKVKVLQEAKKVWLFGGQIRNIRQEKEQKIFKFTIGVHMVQRGIANRRSQVQKCGPYTFCAVRSSAKQIIGEQSKYL